MKEKKICSKPINITNFKQASNGKTVLKILKFKKSQ